MNMRYNLFINGGQHYFCTFEVLFKCVYHMKQIVVGLISDLTSENLQSEINRNSPAHDYLCLNHNL